MNYPKRYLAQILLEAETPVVIGASEPGVTVDKVVIRDSNQLPYLPATSLAGVLRHSLSRQETAQNLQLVDYFGSTEQGSRLIFSDGLLVGTNGYVQESLVPESNMNPFHQQLRKAKLPKRDHVRMTDRGVAAKTGKFDEQVLFKGARFLFEMELIGYSEDSMDQTFWNLLLRTIQSPDFRLGSGTRKGFGRLKVIAEHSCHRLFDLREPAQAEAYLQKTASLNNPIPGADVLRAERTSSDLLDKTLRCYADSLLLMGAGFGDQDADTIFKREPVIQWQGNNPTITSENQSLGIIPASSIKGALAHRTAFYFNQRRGQFAMSEATPEPEQSNESVAFADIDVSIDPQRSSEEIAKQLEAIQREINALTAANLQMDTPSHEPAADDELLLEQWIGTNNLAVKLLFGDAADRKSEAGKPGVVYIEDCYFSVLSSDQDVRQHIAIDRFTGGAKKHMLFQEKAVKPREELRIPIYVDYDRLRERCSNDADATDILEAFDRACEDIQTGRLPIGAKASQGFGRLKKAQP